LRDRWGRHAVQLINAGGVVTVVLGGSFLVGAAFHSVGDPALGLFGLAGGTGAAGWGWKLWVLAVGFGLTAFACADREPGPAYLGVLLLVEFAVLVGAAPSGRGSLVGWPLFLLVIGAIGMIVGLRPRRPLPPPPGSEAGAAPTVPLNREDR
jgi:hypothetical protein